VAQAAVAVVAAQAEQAHVQAAQAAHTAVAVAHAAAMAQAQAQAHQQHQQQQTQILSGDNDPGQSPVVLMLDNPTTNNQTPTGPGEAVIPNGPLQPFESLANAQIVESLAEARIVEQNRLMTMEIVNNNQLAANIQASTVGAAAGIIGQSVSTQMFISDSPQSDSILSSAQPPPMDNLLNPSPIVQPVPSTWNIPPTSGPPDLVVPSASAHLINVGEHMVHSAAVDANILSNSSPPPPPPAQTLTFVTENPQLEMQTVSHKSNDDNVSEFSPPHLQPPSRPASSDAQDSLPNENLLKDSPKNETRAQVDDETVNPDTSHTPDDNKDHNSNSPRSNSGTASGSPSNSPRDPSITSVQLCTDKVESSKTAESQVITSNWSITLEDMTLEQLYARLGQYEHPNLTREQLVEKLKCFGKNQRSCSSECNKQKRQREDSRRSSFSEGSGSSSSSGIVHPLVSLSIEMNCVFGRCSYFQDTSTDDNDTPLTPADTDDIKQESENVAAGSSQSSP
ncbi:1005_t:CDS:2, partial [Acaulospora morrowiae]